MYTVFVFLFLVFSLIVGFVGFIQLFMNFGGLSTWEDIRASGKKKEEGGLGPGGLIESWSGATTKTWLYVDITFSGCIATWWLYLNTTLSGRIATRWLYLDVNFLEFHRHNNSVRANMLQQGC